MKNELVNILAERAERFSRKRLLMLSWEQISVLLSLAQEISTKYSSLITKLLSRNFLPIISLPLLGKNAASSLLPVYFVWFDKRWLYRERKPFVHQRQPNGSAEKASGILFSTSAEGEGFSPLWHLFTNESAGDGMFERFQFVRLGLGDEALGLSAPLGLFPTSVGSAQLRGLSKNIAIKLDIAIKLEPLAKQHLIGREYELYHSMSRSRHQKVVAEPKSFSSLTVFPFIAYRLWPQYEGVALAESLSHKKLDSYSRVVSVISPSFVRRLSTRYAGDGTTWANVQLALSETTTQRMLDTFAALATDAIRESKAPFASVVSLDTVPRGLSLEESCRRKLDSASAAPIDTLLARLEVLSPSLSDRVSLTGGWSNECAPQADIKVPNISGRAHRHHEERILEPFPDSTLEPKCVLFQDSLLAGVPVGLTNRTPIGGLNKLERFVLPNFESCPFATRDVGKGAELALAPIGRTIQSALAAISGHVSTGQGRVSEAASQAMSAPDPEALASEVYTIIKRRLLLEKERAWSVVF